MIWAFYLLQVLIIAALITIIMLQKSGDGIFSAGTKAFGIRGRSNVVVKITYILGAIFLINNVALSILYKKQYNREMIKETTTQIVKPQEQSSNTGEKTIDKTKTEGMKK